MLCFGLGSSGFVSHLSGSRRRRLRWDSGVGTLPLFIKRVRRERTNVFWKGRAEKEIRGGVFYWGREH